MVEKFEIRRENKLPATSKQVWEAIATDHGNLGWLRPREIEPREGGVITPGPCTVTVWDPPHRFAFHHDGEDGFSLVVDYRIEDQDGDNSVLHTVIQRMHNGVVGDDWATTNDAADKHTDFHHHTLGQYLQYFNGRRATYLDAHGPAAATETNAFAVLRQGLGLNGGTARGDVVRVAPAGLDPLNAVVDYLSPHFLGLRTADGLYRFFGGSAWGWPVGYSLHLFAGDVDRSKTDQAWRGWLDGVFA